MAIVAGISTMAFAQEKKDNCCATENKTCKVDSTKCKDECKSKEFRKGKGKKHGNRHHDGQDFKGLNLTDAQRQQIKDLNKAHKEKMVELNKAHKDAIKAILTPEQAAKLETKKGEKAKKIKEGTIRYDAATEAKLKELSTELQQKKEAIKRTRIAPAMMEKKIQELNEEYAKKRSEVVENSLKK